MAELHFGRAAEGLHLAQRAVSQQVRELGLPLSDRTSRRVRPTPEGVRFPAEARGVFGELAWDARRRGPAAVSCPSAGGRRRRFPRAARSAAERIVVVVESWEFADEPGEVSAETVVGLLRERIAAGRLHSCLNGEPGRILIVVSNGRRAQVVFSDLLDDPDGHAIDPGAEGVSGGYPRSNGRPEEIPDAHTVPLEEALRIVRHFVAHSAPPPDAAWHEEEPSGPTALTGF
ncbi:hypothetical protein GCM10022221_65670 [Actinocorallia aurea]